jgi:Flp pilus assembly protein TadG
MMLKRNLSRDQRGIGATEFALVAPVLISFVIGISQMGKLFFANADIKNAAAAGARAAAVWPIPEDAVIVEVVKDHMVRTGASTKITPTVFRGTENGNPYIEINTTASVPLDFIFFSLPAMTLKDTRKVFLQVSNANETQYSGSTTSASTTSGDPSTSSGDPSTSTSSTSATSAGGTSSTSSTSTSASSTSTSSTSSTTSSSSSGNNGSSGNASSGGDKHDHGDCKKKCG